MTEKENGELPIDRMTIREHMATQLLQGFIVSPNTGGMSVNDCVEEAISTADFLLAQLSITGEEA